MKKAILTVGVSASGKSRWAEEFVAEQAALGHEWRIVCRDDIRAKIQGRELVDWDSWKMKSESVVNDLQTLMIHDASEAGANIIIADTNLNEKFRNKLMKSLEFLGFEVGLKEFDVTLEEAWRRDSRREAGVGHSVIAKQFQSWIEFKRKKGDFKVFEPDDSLPNAIIVDIDGTLAHGTGRSMFDFNRVKEDAPDEMVIQVVNGLRANGHKVIVLSGRDEKCKSLTLEWLKEHGVQFDELFMRARGDNRKDTVIKEEFFWNEIAHRFNVRAVFDDRPSVCRVWQRLGIKTFILGNPWIEF